MSGIYLLAGIVAVVFYGATFLRRLRRWLRLKDRRSRRELMEASVFVFTALNLFGVTLGVLIALPRTWVGVGVGATVAAFVVAGWVFDREDRDDGPA